MSEADHPLPPTWRALPLGYVLNYGATEKVEPEAIEPTTWVLELEDVERDSSRVLQRITYSERLSKSTKNRFARGDVLYGKLRPYLNKVVYADSPGVCTTEIVPIKGNAACHSRYLFHWLRHPAFLRYVTEVSHGVNMPRLGTEAGLKAPFVLAPIAEQQRIANKLDTVLARVDACRDRLAGVEPLLKRLRQSVVDAATTGGLTDDWRAANAKYSWRQRSLDDACKSVADGDHQAPPQVNHGVPFITIAAINDGRLSLEKSTRCVPQSYFDALADKRRPTFGDVLFSVTGSLGIAALVDTHAAFAFQRHIAILRPDTDQVLSKYLLLALSTSVVRKSATDLATGTAQLTLSLSGLRKIPIELPSLAEQTQIVRRVQTLFAYADRLQTRLLQAQTAVNRLTPSLLAKAFRGELVPQDPADEPASVLLQRLAQNRASPAPKTRKPRAEQVT